MACRGRRSSTTYLGPEGFSGSNSRALGSIMRSIQRVARPFLMTLALSALSVVSLAGQAPNEVPRGDGEQVERPAAAAEAIAQLKSPYCPTMLEVCSSSQGAALRDSLVTFAEMGWTTEELVDWVVANHGEHYRALPKKEGKALVAWIVPPVGVVLGILVLTMALRGMIRPASDPEIVAEEISSEQEDSLREAMRALDKEEEATFF